ncbi:TIGR02270 family protein [Pseudoduganella sp. SL102]|uniref:TIGR02270 family protein n=1 Tax=Pseudoduganella sp. SL102 TaxID=2995154 RepID=UPI00248ADB43|nr:TIGR02270 family protein [Pseudoduganella sp. SL102]WBS00585.1 TIGR02270 family protein [Pseudoduganella sp. SL102]
MHAISEQPLPHIVAQHAEEAVLLFARRGAFVNAPHVGLRELGRFDERLAAHLDGLAVAGGHAQALSMNAVLAEGAGGMFVAAVLALDSGHAAHLATLFALAEGAAPLRPALAAGFGWASGQRLKGTIAPLLRSGDAFRHAIGLAACAMHQVDCGNVLDTALGHADAQVRARALRMAGEGGRTDALPACAAALRDGDPECRLWAARSVALLGKPAQAAAALQAGALERTGAGTRAFRLLLKVLALPDANAWLKAVAPALPDRRLLVQGAGISGDVAYVPWLIRLMDEPPLARLAGEAFATIAGVDIAALALDRPPPGAAAAGPSDDPDDDDVAMDDDDALPWPDGAAVSAWWAANGKRFAPGVRYFMGQAPAVAHCQGVLRDGGQRQRIAAAEYLCLLQPGTKLFQTAAPAWRQARWLSAMG